MIRRRRIGEEDLLLIRGLIGAEGHLGRSHISNRLCEIWDWRQANGRFRQIACRALLRQLDRKGLVSVPPLPTRPGGSVIRMLAPRAIFWIDLRWKDPWRGFVRRSKSVQSK